MITWRKSYLASATTTPTPNRRNSPNSTKWREKGIGSSTKNQDPYKKLKTSIKSSIKPIALPLINSSIRIASRKAKITRCFIICLCRKSWARKTREKKKNKQRNRKGLRIAFISRSSTSRRTLKKNSRIGAEKKFRISSFPWTNYPSNTSKQKIIRWTGKKGWRTAKVKILMCHRKY